MAPDGIAIIGMAARVPGARDVRQMWANLVAGLESISQLSREDQLARGVPAGVVDNPAFVSAAPVLEDMDHFDADYFMMTPREAEITDPQHRLFLELSHTALEDAGYDPHRYEESIGVYGGCGPDKYRWRNVEQNSALLDATNWLAVTVGNYPDYFATRVSYRLDLRGPSYGLQTACSTSLVAFHVACEALLRDECDMALAGGACIELPHGVGYLYDGGVTSRDGHCRPFDASASGTVWSSGGGVVLLKRVSRALADGDTIRAVVLGSAINNDGALKSGMTAPSARGQSDAARRALAKAGVDPRSVTYVEAHGTGTQVGDPVELAGLSLAYGADTDRTGWCRLGSIKSNVGHLSQAAGVVGVIKTVLSLEHAQIPPTINFTEPNSALNLERSPFRIATGLHDWERGDTPRRAAISSFGIGGTNAHVVLEEAPRRAGGSPREPAAQVLQVSARSPEALEQLLGNLGRFLGEAAGLDLADVAHTLRVGRSVHRHRATAVLGATAEPTAAADPKLWRHGIAAKQPPSVALLFSGQGSQYQGMAATLYDTEPEFAAAVDECLTAVEPDLGKALRSLLLEPAVAGESLINRTEYAQPTLFMIEYALGRLWMSWGLQPAAMIGHSVGEYVAATLAGVFAVPDAMRLVVCRGWLMQSTGTGSMLAITVDGEVGVPDLPAELSVACVNAPGAVVVSGPTAAVSDYAAVLARRAVDSKPLRTSHAFHSVMMEPILAEFRAEVAAVAMHPPTRRYLSNLTGTWQTAERAQDPDYWVEHLRGPVEFAANVATVCEDGEWVFVECGPGSQLTNLVLAQAPTSTQAVASTPGPGPTGDPRETLLRTTGALWTLGLSLEDRAFGAPGRRMPLPTYPYQRRRHWATPDPMSSTPSNSVGQATSRTGPNRIEDWFHTESWRQDPRPPAPEVVPNCLLFVADARGERIGRRLRANGVAVVEIRAGSQFREEGQDRFEIDPADPVHYQELVRAVTVGDIGRIVHAWSLAEPPTGANLEAIRRGQERGFYSVMHLVQALTTAGLATPVHLDLLTTGVHDVVGGDLTSPEQATISGIAKVLPLEGQLFSVRHIDVGPATASDDEADAEDIVTELHRPAGRMDTVALRNSRRWLPEYRELVMGERPDGIRQRGVYLITGGLGAIGLTLAEDLAERAQARLVLTSRIGLPERRTWDRYLSARGAADRTGRAIEAIRRMERHGAEVRVVAADVTDTADMATVHDTIVAEFGELHGVIHAAGLPSGAMLEIQDREASDQVLAPKVLGTIVVQQAMQALRPDFLVLCSSITAAFGRLGHADYCAANSFLDAYACHAAHGPTRVLSVGWDVWLDIGMAADQSEPEHLRLARQAARRGQAGDQAAIGQDEVGISPADGVAAFHRLVASDLRGHVLVSVLPVAAARAGWQVDIASLGATPPAGGSVEPAAESSLEETLANIWADTLGHPVVGLDQDFVELGGDSLTSIRLLARIREATDVAVSRRSLFEASTVRRLAMTINDMRSGDAGAGVDAAAPADARPVEISRLSRPRS